MLPYEREFIRSRYASNATMWCGVWQPVVVGPLAVPLAALCSLQSASSNRLQFLLLVLSRTTFSSIKFSTHIRYTLVGSLICESSFQRNFLVVPFCLDFPAYTISGIVCTASTTFCTSDPFSPTLQICRVSQLVMHIFGVRLLCQFI